MDKHKLEVMNEVMNGTQTVYWAAAKLKKSERTIKRYIQRLKENSNDDLIHKNRNKVPVNKLDHEKIRRVF